MSTQQTNGAQPPASGSSSSSSSSAPVRKECNIPGKSCWTLWRTDFLIDEKYIPIKAIGKGAYGVVCSAKNYDTGEKVAIKKIANAFENLTDARRILREIKLLRSLKHENIIAVRDLFKPPSRSFNDVYIIYDLMDTDLHQIIRSQQPLSNEHFQYFVYQVSAMPGQQAALSFKLLFSALVQFAANVTACRAAVMYTIPALCIDILFFSFC